MDAQFGMAVFKETKFPCLRVSETEMITDGPYLSSYSSSAHIWCSVSKTSTDMRCTRIEEVSQTVEDRIAQGVLSYTCMISSSRLYISTTLMQSNAPIGNLNQKTCSISKIARGPYSLHSNIHGSTCNWHATSTHRTLTRDSFVIF